MIFITTGSRFQFNRLLKAVDEAIDLGLITDKVFAQTGNSDYKIRNFEFVDYLKQEDFNKKIQECDLVLTHGGTGIIVNSAKLGKRIVAIPRLKEFNEVVDDHQIQLIKAFEQLKIVTPCWECTAQDISNAIGIAKNKEIVEFKSNSKNIIESIDSFIEGKESNNKSIRVLMCSSARSEKGGMNSVIEQLMNHDWGDSIKLSYLATHISGNVLKKTMFFAKSLRQLKKEIKNNSFDIIHIHMSYKGSFHRKYIVAKKCKKHGKKVIIHLHGSEFKDFYNKGNKKLKKKIIELFTITDQTIVLGESWKEFIKEISPKANVVVINNAIGIPDIGDKKENEIPSLLFLGALIKRKGVMDLLCAVSELKDKMKMRLFIAGTGNEEDALKKFVEEKNLSENVTFLGWIDNTQKPELMMKSDILVLPSYNEGLPIAILEALSYGLPIISTEVGSISEAVVEGENGYLFNPGDVNSLKEKIEKLVLDRELWKQMSLNARQTAIRKFSENSFFSEIDNIYHMLYEQN